MLDIMTAAPREIRIGNAERSRVLKVGALKLAELGLLQRWIRDHAIPPLVRLEEELKVAPEDQHRDMKYKAWVEQRDDWPPAPYSPKGVTALFANGSDDGIRFFLDVFLRKHNEVSDDEITFYMKCLDMADLDAMVGIAFGADDIDPKAVWAAARSFRYGTTRQPTGSSPPSSVPVPEDSAEPGESGSIQLTASLPTSFQPNSPS